MRSSGEVRSKRNASMLDLLSSVASMFTMSFHGFMPLVYTNKIIFHLELDSVDEIPKNLVAKLENTYIIL